METTYVCSKCGKPAAQDHGDVYLVCGCDKNSVWINDGRGGYSVSNAKPVEAEKYFRD